MTAGQGRPNWVFSCYGPGRNAPRQLFGGPQREQSFEELRLRHYEATAAGNPNQALQEAQALYAESLSQMEVILRDLDGAVKYILDGANEHPNRIDISEGKTGPVQPGSQGPSPFGQPSAFGQPSGMTPQPSGFGQPSAPGSQPAFGKPSGFGQPSAFGQPSSMGQAPGFGQPSSMGQRPAFGQPAPLGGQPAALGSQSPFGKPGFGQSGFGQPQPPQPQQPAFGQSGFGQPSALGASGFGKASNTASPFNQLINQNQGTAGFAQPSGQAATSPFGQVAAQQPAAPSGFGQPSSQPSGFGQAAPAASPFGKPQQQPSPFGQVSQPAQPAQPAAAANPFGAPAQPAAGFGQSEPKPSGFAQLQPQQPAAVQSATAGTGPPAILRIQDPSDLNPIPPLSGQTTRNALTKRLDTWKGQPVKYIDNVPCYLHPQDRQTYVHIFFPDGPPDAASLRDAHGKPEEYTPEVTEQYEFFVKNGYFKDGVIPSVPPKTEWVSFDF